MILSKYNEIMDKIVVTPEMQERILQNIRNSELKKEKTNIISFKKMKKYASIAACLAVLIIGAASIALWNQSGNGAGHDDQEMQNPGVQATYGGIIEQNNKEALEQTVGFSVKEPDNLPFEVTEIQYLSYWDEMAEITYSGEKQEVVYRQQLKTQENEDISGDYNEYEHEKQIVVNHLNITMKGKGNAVSLAVWQDETYSYSIMVTEGITQSEMEQLIESMN